MKLFLQLKWGVFIQLWDINNLVGLQKFIIFFCLGLQRTNPIPGLHIIVASTCTANHPIHNLFILQTLDLSDGHL